LIDKNHSNSFFLLSIKLSYSYNSPKSLYYLLATYNISENKVLSC
jgi:hypothetical protein